MDGPFERLLQDCPSCATSDAGAPGSTDLSVTLVRQPDDAGLLSQFMLPIRTQQGWYRVRLDEPLFACKGRIETYSLGAPRRVALGPEGGRANVTALPFGVLVDSALQLGIVLCEADRPSPNEADPPHCETVWVTSSTLRALDPQLNGPFDQFERRFEHFPATTSPPS
ncbi:MAG: hypothetical protein U0414_32680 [Polyangiaceae bacterium]